jgi:hypothetical protein
MIIGVLLLCRCFVYSLEANSQTAPPEPMAANQARASSTWEGLTAAVSQGNFPADSEQLKRWLGSSLSSFQRHPSAKAEDLNRLWGLMLGRYGDSGGDSFMFKRLFAFRQELESLGPLPDKLPLSRAHALLLESMARFSEFPPSYEYYDHARFARFSLLAALFARAQQDSLAYVGQADPEWDYLIGRADQFIRVGGEERLISFLERSSGRSAYSSLAIKALQEAYSLPIWRFELGASARLQELKKKEEAYRKEKVASGDGSPADGVYAHGEVMIQVDHRGANSTVSVHAWDGAVLARRVFAEEEFESVGGSARLWVPQDQPVPGLFMISKHGSYAGRSLLITLSGRLLEFPGGAHFYDPTGQLLFLAEQTDTNGLITVLDKNWKVIAASHDPAKLVDLSGKQIACSDVLTFTCWPSS